MTLRTPAAGGGPRWLCRAVLLAVCALVIGVFAWRSDSGALELWSSRPADTYYNLLVRGFRSGQLNVKQDVPAGLAQLSDPYDPIANLPYRWGEQPLHDMSYYQGKLHLYFGITPAVLLFWPYAVLTGQYLLHKQAAVFFCAIGFLASAGLLQAIRKRYFPEVPFATALGGTVALGLGSGLVVMLARCDVYEVAVSCGYALVMLALAAIWRALQEPKRGGLWLTAASLAYGLAVGARPSLICGAVILLIPVLQAWTERRLRIQEDGVRPSLLLMAAVGPLVVVGMGLMWYNAARFGNPLEFGARYQLEADRHGAMFSLQYLPRNFRAYFLGPAHWSAGFPFVSLPENESRFGILTNTPLTWLALAVPLALRGRSMAASALLWFAGAVLLLTVISAFTMGLFFGAAPRYEEEFLPALMLLSMIGWLGLERALATQLAWQWVVRAVCVALLGCSVAFNVLASFERQAQGRNYLGKMLRQAGRVDEAILNFQGVLDIRADHVEAHNNLGIALAQKGRTGEAIAQFKRSMELAPGFTMAYLNLGNTLFLKGETEEAIWNYQKALELQPDLAVAHLNLGKLQIRQGQKKEAIDHFEKALALDADNPDPHNSLANALLESGRVEEAAVHYEKTLAANPDLVSANNNLAWMLATCPKAAVRNGPRALELARHANQLTANNNPMLLRTLAAAYAETGKFPEAITSAQAALQLAEDRADAALAATLRTEIRIYQTGSPLRDKFGE